MSLGRLKRKIEAIITGRKSERTKRKDGDKMEVKERVIELLKKTGDYMTNSTIALRLGKKVSQIETITTQLYKEKQVMKMGVNKNKNAYRFCDFSEVDFPPEVLDSLFVKKVLTSIPDYATIKK